LTEIAAARTALESAITDALDGGRTAVAIRRARQKELTLLLSQLAGHVASLAEGNTLAILSSGFEVKRASTPAGEPIAPTDLQADIGSIMGRVDLRWKPVKQAVAYQVQINTKDSADPASWQIAGISTKARFKVTGLATATVTWFRVAAIGTGGMGAVSDVAHSLAK
jgi:hypothetical protein